MIEAATSVIETALSSVKEKVWRLWVAAVKAADASIQAAAVVNEKVWILWVSTIDTAAASADVVGEAEEVADGKFLCAIFIHGFQC